MVLVSLLFDDLSGHSYPSPFLMFLNFLFVQFVYPIMQLCRYHNVHAAVIHVDTVCDTQNRWTLCNNWTKLEHLHQHFTH